MNTQRKHLDEEKITKGLQFLKVIYDDGSAEINDRSYKFHQATHKQRKKVFGFYSKIGNTIETGDLSFISSDEFEPVEDIINNLVSYDGSLLSKIPNHWEEHPEDYLTFIPIAMGVISYPLLKGRLQS